MAEENVTNLTTDVDIKGTIKFAKDVYAWRLVNWL